MCMSLIVKIHYWQPYRLAPLKMSWPSLALPLQKSWRRHWFWARANFSGETSVPLAYWKKSHHGIIYHSTHPTGGRGVHPLKLFDTSPTPPQLEVLIVLTPLCMLCTAGGYYMTKLGYYSSLYCIKNFSFWIISAPYDKPLTVIKMVHLTLIYFFLFIQLYANSRCWPHSTPLDSV